MTTRLVIYEGVMQGFITEHAVRFVTSTADEVKAAAKVMVPKRSGLLDASIHATGVQTRNMRASVRVGSELDYAAAVHQGQSAHTERADPGEVLNLGDEGVATFVHHPATHGVPYLYEPLEAIGRRLGFTVTRVHEP